MNNFTPLYFEYPPTISYGSREKYYQREREREVGRGHEPDLRSVFWPKLMTLARCAKRGEGGEETIPPTVLPS